jgi:carbonic anhydrase/acetyltransferase-like protein (isoleucine patch superfamily)
MYNTIGNANTASGYNALQYNTTGKSNSAIGAESLYINTTGSQNSAFGSHALHGNITGKDNTAIGFGADVTSGSLINATVIGANAKVNSSNKVRIGDENVTVIEGQVPWSTTSDLRLKENIISNNVLGLNFILKLNPKRYNYISDKTKTMHDGFIAQEVEEAVKDLKLPFSGIQISQNGTYSLTYSDFVMPLVNAVKEQQTIIEELKKKNENYESMIQNLSNKIENIEKKLSAGIN